MPENHQKILDVLKSRMPDKEKLKVLKKETRFADDAIVRLIYDADCKGEVQLGAQTVKL